MSTQDKKPTTNPNNPTAKTDQNKQPMAGSQKSSTQNPTDKKRGKEPEPDTKRTTMQADKNQPGRKDSK